MSNLVVRCRGSKWGWFAVPYLSMFEDEYPSLEATTHSTRLDVSNPNSTTEPFILADENGVPCSRIVIIPYICKYKVN